MTSSPTACGTSFCVGQSHLDRPFTLRKMRNTRQITRNPSNCSRKTIHLRDCAEGLTPTKLFIRRTMSLVTPTRRANACPAGGGSDRYSITRDSRTRAIAGKTSMGVDLNTRLCVTGRAEDSLESWYNLLSQEGPHKAVSGYDDCPISGPRTMLGGSVSGGEKMVTSEVEKQDINAAARPRSEVSAKRETSPGLHSQLKRSGLFSDKRVRFTVLSGGGSS